jgi:uncharacterized protein YjbI with pentapeptide repeats
MANEEQLAILEKGVEVWNKWRSENLGITINLAGADLSGAKLSRANLNRTDLGRADLNRTDLTEANLTAAHLSDANLKDADLSGADLGEAETGFTVFGNMDLSKTIGLEEVYHVAQSTVGIDTLRRSKGKIPAAFLRGCGLSDFEIESAKLYNPDLSNQKINDILYKIYDLRARQAIQVSPLFISYSHADAIFVDRLEVCLNKKGIRFWRDIHDAKVGDPD